MKRLLITGATGFLGTNLMERIDRKEYEVFVLGRMCPKSVDKEHFFTYDLMKADIHRMYAILDRIKAEVLVMLAWNVSTQSYWESYENHIWAGSSIQLAKMFLDTGGGFKQILFFGTSASYDYELGWLKEKPEYEKPFSVYGITKLYASRMIEKLAKDYGAAYCEARIFSAYGKYERSSRLVPSVIRHMLKGEKITIDKGGLMRDYLFAEDVAAAVYTCIRKRAEGVYNISSGEPVTIRQIVMQIADILGTENLVEFCIDEKQKNPPLIVGDNLKIRSLGFQPRYRLDEGIHKILEWMKEEDRV